MPTITITRIPPVAIPIKVVIEMTEAEADCFATSLGKGLFQPNQHDTVGDRLYKQLYDSLSSMRK